MKSTAVVEIHHIRAGVRDEILGKDASIRGPMLWFLLVASGLFAAIGDLGEAAILLVAITRAVVLGYERSLSAGVEHARAMALVALIIASATVTAGFGRLRTWAGRIMPLAAATSAVLLIQAPTLARLVHVAPLHLDDWGLASAGGIFAGVIAAWLKPNGVNPRSA